ncbi:MAG: ABC transporter ATP-binding protein [Candidatus Limnocylindria bacterium]
MIEAIALGKRFRSLTAVHELSFTVGDGEIFGLLGPNGAGKTTSVRILSGLIAASEGRARINDLELGPDSQRIRAITGILTEAPGLHDKLTARENLGYYGRLYGLRGGTLRRAVDRYLGIVGLPDVGDRRVGGFSKGMRQKVAIARALLHEPDVLYLDEPTSALDPSAAKTVRDFVATLRDAGRSIVVCTHNLDEAERLCDRIGIMRGTLLRVDTPARLRRRNGTASVRVELVGARRPESFLDMLAALPFIEGARALDGALFVEVGDPRGDNPELVRALVDAGARVVGINEEAVTLEQVYLDLVGEVAERDARRIGEVA